MIQCQETLRTLPYYRPIPLTGLPMIYQREHLFPYTSYGDTESVAVERKFRMVVLENDFLRVEVAPELGGRVYSLFDKRIGKEILFSNPVVKPVRILPIWGFISGGIEFNFPIAHSPTSIAAVGCTSGCDGNYGFIRVGEREARTGMEWVVELGLMDGSAALLQRTALRNQTGRDHPWMMWTICAVRSTEGTEFIHPPHRVLVHDDRLVEADWPGDGLNWDRNARQMTALFWKPGSATHFGAFHHDLGFGLMHLADPAQLPGKKVWTYGYGKDRGWGQASTQNGLCYAEIESGPLIDQGEKPLFRSGEERHFEEFWIPVHSRAACDHVAWPKMDLPAWRELPSPACCTQQDGRGAEGEGEPWLGWTHSAWQGEWERFRQDGGTLPASCVPTGLELEVALRRELAQGNPQAAEPLALWLAFRGRPAEALPLVQTSPQPTAQRIAGLILWKGLNEPARAVPHLEAGPPTDPIAVVELDELYTELRMLDKRAALLSRAVDHRLVIERRADLALAAGSPETAIRLLHDGHWPREHQRYIRSELWKKAQATLGNPSDLVPDSLNEDNLARFGAYWAE